MKTKPVRGKTSRSKKDSDNAGNLPAAHSPNFGNLFDNMLEGVMLIGFDWTYLYLNEAAAQHGHEKREELLGRSMLEAYPGVEGSEIFAHYRECMEKRTPQRFEASFTFADGRLNWYELSVEPAEEGILVLSIDRTLRKQAEEALHESEERYCTVIGAMAEGVVVHAPSGEIVSCNASAERILGLTADQLIGRTSLDPYWLAIHEDGSPFPGEEHPAMVTLRSGAPCREVVMGVHKPDDTLTWISVNTQPVEVDGSKPRREVIVSFVDITERKQMHDGLRENEARFRQMFENHNAIMLLIEPDTGAIIDANLAAQKFYGYSIEQLKWMKIEQINMLLSEEVKQQRQRTARESLNNFIFPHRLASGEIRQVEVHSSPIMIRGKTILFSIIHDVTERRRAEEKLRESEAGLKHSQAAAHLGHWIWDFAASPVSYSDEIFHIYGLDPSSFSGNPYEAIDQAVHPEDRPKMFAIGEAVRRGETPPPAEYRVVWPDGSVHTIYTEISEKLYDGQGQVVKVMGFAQDITERKRNEEELRDRTADLQIVNAVNEAANRGEDIEGIANAFAQSIHETFNCHSVAVYLLSPDGRYLEMQSTTLPKRLIGAIEETIGCPLPKIQIPLEQGGYLEHLLAQTNGVILDSPQEIQAWMEQFVETTFLPAILREPIKKLIPRIWRLIAIHSVCIIPLFSQGKAVGMLDMSSNVSFTREHLERMHSVSIQITSAILRRQLERAMRESEEKYRGLMESLNAVVSMFDANGRLTYLNPVAASQFGGTASEMIGKTMYELFPEPVASRQWNSLQQIIQQDQPLTVESVSVIQGKPRWYRTSMQPIHDQQGRVTHVLINATDIHEIKTMQQELLVLNHSLEEKVRERTAQVQDLYDNAPVGYHSLDADGNFVAVNQTELNWLGYTREELLGKPVTIIFSPKSIPTFRENFPHFKASGILKDVEFEIVRKDGTTFLALANAIATYDAGGNYLSSRSTLADITDRKRAEKLLRENEARMDFAFRATQDGIWDWNMETDEVFYSPRWKSMLGYEDAEIMNHVSEWKRLLHPDDLQRSLQVVEDVMRGEREYMMEFRMRHKDGHYVDVLSRGIPIHQDTNGPIVRIVGTHFDLTERKQAEEALLFANSELERTMRLKDEFLASMSHELRTPLTGILGLSEALQLGIYGKLSDKQVKTLATIYDSGRHLLELINDILDLSKIQAEKLDMEFSPISVQDICQSSLSLVKGMANKRQQAVRFRPPSELIMVYADGRRLKQILVNLLSNAIKFTPEKGELGLEVHANRDAGTVQLVVWDKGIGIKPEHLPRLFRPFEQIDGRLAREYSGTGLGLSLVHNLVEMHHGSVQVESVFGEGSRFIVILPLSSEGHGSLQTA